MSLADPSRRAPLWHRLFRHLPGVDRDADDPAEREAAQIWLGLGVFVCVWAVLVLIFGLPGLYLPALALVPVVFLALLLISMG